jgi:Rieske Fe-S protein
MDAGLNRVLGPYVVTAVTMKRSTISRRRALAGVATAGVAVPVLAACGDDGSDTSSSSTDTSSARTDTSAANPDTSAANPDTSAGDGIPTSDVPVGGGVIEDDVVITQPTKGDFRAFSAACTHQGCLVAEVSDGFIICPCHGSHFAIDTGEPTSDSLATAPLGAVDITVTRNQITVG